ncbi:MAG: PIG-L family deacetylase [Acidobacteria bacterium]|nr:PIG-L family deacetylase [Acidobacteriota bacterium]
MHQQNASPPTCRRRRTAASLTFALLAALFLSSSAAPSTPWQGASELHELLNRLGNLGSILILGAHPDDERETMIAYFSRGQHLRSAYLSATRGEGGQNLIGSEQAELLGVIRTQELLAARRFDGGEQFFTRAIDFGFSKSPEEALAFWGRERVLGDIVRTIRRFRPDVILSRFSPTESSGHGHHTAIGYIAREAYEAAADPKRFPEQIKQGLTPWKATRLYWSPPLFTRRHEEEQAKRTDRLRVNTGEYNPVLGASYAEIGGAARSMHRSQGMGSGQRKGDSPAYFGYLAGEEAQDNLFDGIDTTWSRVQGGDAVRQFIDQARDEYRPGSPETIVPLLLKAYEAVRKIEDGWARVKEREILRAIELAAGLWIDAAADRWDVAAGAHAELTLSIVNRSGLSFEWQGADVSGAVSQALAREATPLPGNQVITRKQTIEIPAGTPYSQPAWLRKPSDGNFYHVDDPHLIGLAETPAPLQVTFEIQGPGGVAFSVTRPVIYRWVDDAQGELTRRTEIVPTVAVRFTEANRIFPDAWRRNISVEIESRVDQATGEVSLRLPAGWQTLHASQPFQLERRGMRATLAFELHPPAEPGGGFVTAQVRVGGQTIETGIREIDYPHFPVQVVFPKAEMRVERADVKLLSKNIGYIMGSGDKVPEALEQLGARVTLVGDDELTSGDLARFDAIILGIRALNTRAGVLAAKERLLSYVESGGTLVVQYNTAARRGPTDVLGPYPLTASSERVSEENAPVRLLESQHPLLESPNRISGEDFEGWVQERGLYFMTEWDERYDALLESSDSGEPPRRGGLLYARHGKGIYIFTGYSWFRQLPAGVPGAYRIFANLVSAGKTP